MKESEAQPGKAPSRDVAIGLVVRDGKVLICQRPEGKSFAGHWEFPGGKREPGETVRACLEREIREELGIGVRPTMALGVVEHDYPRGSIRLHPFVCEHLDGEPRPLASQAVRWVEPGALRDYLFPPANEGLIEEAILCLRAAAGQARSAPRTR